jgi:ribosomal protein S18 acetylase RimI-like enzyme
MRIEVDEPSSRVVAAIDDDGGIVGLATAGVTRDHDRATDWELYSINVTAQQQGSGMADELIRLAVGETDTTVWVRRENARAQGFYARHGFTLEGSTTPDEDTGVGEIRMVRRSAKR